MTTSFPAKKEAGQLRVQNADEESKEAIRFPCIDRLEKRETALKVQHEEVQRNGESTRDELFLHVVSGYEVFEHKEDFVLSHGGKLPGFKVAYETWGELNANKDNAILLHTGLSASSHAKSHAKNKKAGWWEEFIGPGLAIDTNKYFVICTNVLGGCYGSTGPSSINPKTGKRYATRFPILTINDMIHAQFLLLDHLGINKLHASVGSSMGGMQSLAAACLYPERVALRFAQRQVLLSDPHFNRGEYYDGIVPHVGMKLARQISTITYRSGPEWEQRFGRRRQNIGSKPALCPDFMIESYIDHQSEKFCLNYDANSLLYISKAMDMFDITKSNTSRLEQQRKVAIEKEKKVQKEETVQGYELEANPDITTNSDFIKKEKGGAGEAHKITDWSLNTI
ncbi:putative serine-O-acetyltransferase cys2 [Zancudomyces culisetae]|uniref:Putative serine-O-acetyltransferase cys2 n=1 Tax=Zancudomyces culisetae TaxID=1213189 RepID=A0A1R1PHR8_ZANCU|nr:putative serine-O-acetyltransferase cys2 [Zancudomyces culisetae]|eukprot:OMH80545.1 putative serine-O-acetyltransferase cys2 [Zancudomyces culisetae]